MDVGCNHEQLNEVQHQLKEKNSKCVILLSLKFTELIKLKNIIINNYF